MSGGRHGRKFGAFAIAHAVAAASQYYLDRAGLCAHAFPVFEGRRPRIGRRAPMGLHHAEAGAGGGGAGGGGTGGGTGGGGGGTGNGGAGGGGSGGGSGGAGGGTGGGENDDVVSRGELVKVIQGRDREKKKNKALSDSLAALGLATEPDPDNPDQIRIVAGDIEDLPGTLAAIRDKRIEKLKPNELKTQLENEKKTAVEAVQTVAKKRESKLIQQVESLALIGPLRAALAAAHVIDGGPESERGQYNDQITLLRPFFKVDVGLDDEGEAPAKVEIYAVKPDGTPRTDNAGKRVGVDAIVKEYLATRPHLIETKFRGGPGAGGRTTSTTGAGNSRTAGASSLSPADAGRQAAAAMFGGPRDRNGQH